MVINGRTEKLRKNERKSNATGSLTRLSQCRPSSRLTTNTPLQLEETLSQAYSRQAAPFPRLRYTRSAHTTAGMTGWCDPVSHFFFSPHQWIKSAFCGRQVVLETSRRVYKSFLTRFFLEQSSGEFAHHQLDGLVAKTGNHIAVEWKLGKIFLLFSFPSLFFK